MSDRDKQSTSKVTLDIELKDLVDAVSGSKTPPITGLPSRHAAEGEELKKIWFTHMLESMEKFGNTIHEIRTKDFAELKKELKCEFQKEIVRIDQRISNNETSIETYKREVIKPISDKLTTLVVKVGIWGILAGFVGSGLMGLVLLLLREYVFAKGGS